ncbi:BRO-N domain-containing protein [Simiaoa sp.]|uniref:BRO-N domain-containing protein n=1 Tax=Simiaoa sp. TaxID=2944202 RepID=UPI003F81E7C9
MFFYYYDKEKDTTVPMELDDNKLNTGDFEFFNDGIRKVWNSQEEEWYFSIIDVVAVLTESTNPKNYWNMLKSRLKQEGNETYTNCVRLKMKASDGKMRLTDCATTEQLLRIIQSIPSKKAEPFKLWLAQVGTERLEEMADPEKALDRGMEYYRRKGYTDAWIKERLQSKSIRDDLTAEWKRSGIESSREFAALTNILTKSWSGKTVQEYKRHKNLHNENLRDNMTNLELTLNQLAEVSATAISKVKNPNGMEESKKVAIDGGTIARNARLDLERQLGQSVISPLNASDPPALEIDQTNSNVKSD